MAAWAENTPLSTRSRLRMMLAACLFKDPEDRSTRVLAEDGNGGKLRQELMRKQLIHADEKSHREPG